MPALSIILKKETKEEQEVSYAMKYP